MGDSTKSAGDKPKKESGGAALTPMVGFHAKVGVSGPGYSLEAGKKGDIPKVSAEVLEAEGKGKIVKEKVND